MTGRTVGRAITASVVGLMIGTYGVVRADCRAVKGAAQDAGKPRRGSHETAQRALRASGSGVSSHHARA